MNVKDFALVQDEYAISFKKYVCDILIQNLWISGAFALFVMIGVGVIHKRLKKKLTDKKELISGHNYVERAIIVDTVGTYVSKYYNRERGDIILNSRSQTPKTPG